MSEEELVRVYRPLVYRYSLRLCGDAVEAEDLTQEALLKALVGLPRFQGRCTAASWLYRITANAWKNRLRAKASGLSRRLLGEGEVSADSWASPEPTPEASALDAEKKGRFAQALARLDDGSREVLLRRAVGGQSYGDIARDLGLPVGTVKSRLSRARRALSAAAVGLMWAAAALCMLLLGGVAMKRTMPGLFRQIQGMISGAANTMGSGGH